MMAWQPISTAPKDGRDVFLVCNGSAHVGRYYRDEHYSHGKLSRSSEGWHLFGFAGFARDPKPTHWMPIPALEEVSA